MSIVVGNHPVPMTVILVQGSSASLVVPSDTGVMAAPSLEFAVENASATPLATHTLALESGEWVVHLSPAQIAALKTAKVARVKDGTRTVAAGSVDPNAGWEGRQRSGVTTQIIFGGGAGGATTLDGLADVTTTGFTEGQTLTALPGGVWGPADPPSASWDTIADKPAVVADGATQAEARGKIGAVDQPAITTAINNLINGAPGALDTLNELSAALGGDANFAASTATALGNRVRVDAEQGLDATNRRQGRTNLSLDDAVYAADYGVTGHDNVSRTAELLSALQAANGRPVVLPRGNVKVSTLLSYDGLVNIWSRPGATTLDLSGGGNLVFTKALTALPALGANIVAGSSTVTFASAHGLLTGDVINVYNPTDFSWSPSRNYYRDGCMFRVDEVVSTTQIRVFGVSPDLYAVADVQVFKLAGAGVSLAGLTVIANPAAAQQIYIDGHRNVVIDDVTLPRSAAATGIEICRSFDVEVESLRAEVIGGDAYPLTISNSQKVTITNSPLFSTRHALGLGGRTGSGCVPTRDVLIDHCILFNRSSLGLGASDMHSNVENVTYSNCFMNTGANIAGKNVRYVNCTIYGRDPAFFADGNIIYGDALGGTYEVDNCRLVTHGNGSTFGAIHLDTPGRVEDVLVLVRSCTLVNAGKQAAVQAVKIAVGDATVTNPNRIDVVIDGLRATSKIACFLLLSGQADLTAKASAIVDNVYCPGGGALLNTNLSNNNLIPMRLMRQSGSQAATATSGTASTIGAPQTFLYPYPKQPHAHVAVTAANLVLNGNKAVLPGLYNLSATSIRPAITTGDATNWTATVATTLMWSAGIEEI